MQFFYDLHPLLSLQIIPMLFREATIKDIVEIMNVRMSVLENVLNTPGLVTERDCKEYLTQKEKAGCAKLITR